MYTYCATLERIIDGDTLELNIDLGFEVWIKTRVRLAGIDSPETFGVKKESEEYQRGMLAKQFVENWFASLGTEKFVVISEKTKEKYGRWIVRIMSEDNTKILNEDIVTAGHAVRVIY